MAWFNKGKKEALVLENDHFKITVEGKTHSLEDLETNKLFFEVDGQKYMAFDGIEVYEGRLWLMWRGETTLAPEGFYSLFAPNVNFSLKGIEGRVKLNDKN